MRTCKGVDGEMDVYPVMLVEKYVCDVDADEAYYSNHITYDIWRGRDDGAWHIVQSDVDYNNLTAEYKSVLTPGSGQSGPWEP